MKTLFSCLLLFCACAAAASAQSPAAAAGGEPAGAPPDVEIVRHSWSKERIGWEGNPFGGTIEDFSDVRRRMADQRRLERARASGNPAEASKVEREMRAEQVIKSRPPKPPRYAFSYKLSVRNTGAKTIKEIDWDYVFLDATTGQELDRREFTGVEKIGPGKMKELAFLAPTPPTQTISAHALGKNEREGLREAIVVVRILYADGTIWRAGASR